MKGAFLYAEYGDAVGPRRGVLAKLDGIGNMLSRDSELLHRKGGGTTGVLVDPVQDFAKLARPLLAGAQRGGKDATPVRAKQLGHLVDPHDHLSTIRVSHGRQRRGGTRREPGKTLKGNIFLAPPKVAFSLFSLSLTTCSALST